MNTITFSQALKANRNTVYGVILNDQDSLTRMGAALSAAPYQSSPQAPVLYLKPANTFCGEQAVVRLPESATGVEIGASIGIVIAASCACLSLEQAQAAIAGYVIVADLSLPHDSYYRPAIREKCFDDACVISDHMVASAAVQHPAALEIVTSINGRQVERRSLRDLLRDIPSLLRDVSADMTLRRGDVLLVGVKWQAAQAGPGDQVSLTVAGLGELHFRIAPQEQVPLRQHTPVQPTQPPTRRDRRFGRIFFNGAIHEVEPVSDGVPNAESHIRLADGRLLRESEAHWLPPLEPGSIFALGLNYADHARELAFKAPEQPLVFLKGPMTLSGHRSHSRRPADATYMHYECELAVVIGKPARHVRREDAYDYVAGYTVANDYAIRDYLENYYRPNLRVKNRDACTPLGPWLVGADAVADPMQLALSTTVNGKLVQRGNTADMLFDIPALIVYLSSILTLAPGDIILTGTPQGLADVVAGDCVVTSIEGIGSLHNTIVSDTTDCDPAAR